MQYFWSKKVKNLNRKQSSVEQGKFGKQELTNLLLLLLLRNYFARTVLRQRKMINYPIVSKSIKIFPSPHTMTELCMFCLFDIDDQEVCDSKDREGGGQKNIS